VIITHRTAEEGGPSSVSMPTMVFTIFGHLEMRPGDRYLEIGTGPGWTASLAASYLGDPQAVYTVEVSHEVARFGRKNMDSLGLQGIRSLCADGKRGCPLGAPFDRVLSTCAVREVPYAWIEQARADAVIVTPWGSPINNGWLLRLTVTEPGVAQGRFVDTAAFMWMRSQQFAYVDEPDNFYEKAAMSSWEPPMRELFDVDDARFFAGIHVPDCRLTYERDDDGVARTAWLLGRDSWGAIDLEHGTVAQLGKRRLADELLAAFTRWSALGAPSPERIGVTVTRAGQRFWLDEPTNHLVTV
jgi:protein-L-isoaspartate O-methyltransferase